MKRYIDESTGVQTIYQMQWLAEKVRQHGRSTHIHDEWWYKDEYNRRLMARVQKRLEGLHAGDIQIDSFLICGSLEFIKLLRSKDVELYIASGTDDKDVKNEVKALGLFNYFTDVNGAPDREVKPYDWHTMSVRVLLNNMVYLGHVVFGGILICGS